MIRVSVTVPVYNTKAVYLDECLKSIKNQTYQPFEIIFIDDGSTRSETLNFLESIEKEVVVFHQDNKKTAAALNAGIKVMNGNWWAGLSSDDQWKPYKLERQVELINSNPEAKIIYGDYELINSQGQVIKTEIEPVFKTLKEQQMYLKACYFGMWSNLLIEKSILNDIGGFNPNFICCEDYDFAIRLSVKNKYHKVPAVLSTYRTHSEQNTGTMFGFQGVFGSQFNKRCHELANTLFK
jgi:glycosyltransferase involved in cell wall biosynthesis